MYGLTCTVDNIGPENDLWDGPRQTLTPLSDGSLSCKCLSPSQMAMNIIPIISMGAQWLMDPGKQRVVFLTVRK